MKGKKLIGKVSIGGYNIPVFTYPKDDMGDNLGEFVGDEYIIKITEDICTSQKRVVLAHECFHAFLFITGYNQQLSRINDDFEESLTLGFEHMLGRFMVFPKKLEDWIDV